MATCPVVDDHDPKVEMHGALYMVHSILHYSVHCMVHHIVIEYQQHEVEAA